MVPLSLGTGLHPLPLLATTAMKIRPYEERDLEGVVRLSLKAWAPVFRSMEAAMDAQVYRHFFRPSWRVTQQEAVEAACRDEATRVWVADNDGFVAGFVALKFDQESKMGEIYMVAVDPDCQKQGIGEALTHFSLEQFKQAGMVVAMVETGGDPGHAPARRTYEKTGFRLLPVARYFKKV